MSARTRRVGMHDCEAMTGPSEAAVDGLDHLDAGPVGEREPAEVEDDVAGYVTGLETSGGELHGADLFELAVDDHRGGSVAPA